MGSGGLIFLLSMKTPFRTNVRVPDKGTKLLMLLDAYKRSLLSAVERRLVQTGNALGAFRADGWQALHPRPFALPN
jgi:hypothetical protein